MHLAPCFDAFLEAHVNLTAGRIQDLQDHVDAISKFLRHQDRLGDLVEDVIPQGSFAQKTIIKPPEDGDEFDADVLLQLPVVHGWEPKDYVARVAREFAESDRYRDKADPGRRCVTVDYAGEFHIDIVPYVVAANGDFITNCETNRWEETNPAGFSKWLAEKDAITDGRLVEVIRLVKFLRECSDVEFAAPSVTLTVLLGELVSEQARDADEYADLARSFVTLMRELNGHLQEHETRPEIPDPTCSAQNFHDRWDEADYSRCRDAVSVLVNLIDAAEAAPNDSQELARWQDIFGEGFVVPEDIASSESGRRGEQFLHRLYGYENDFSAGYKARIDARIEGDGSAFGLRRRRNVVGRSRAVNFLCQTDVDEPHDIFWKIKNTGRDAAAAGQYRGEISSGTPGVARRESTKFRGSHLVEVFVVVDGSCVAHAEHQVRIV